MKHTNKKGFTIVELVIVIAVIAILAAVLIPTFTNLVKKANLSADTQLVKNLNTILAAEEAVNGVPANFSDVIRIIKANGYIVENLNPTTAGHFIVWESTTNQFILVDGEFEVVYAAEALENESIQSTWFFAVKEEGLVEGIKTAGGSVIPAVDAAWINGNGTTLQTLLNKGGVVALSEDVELSNVPVKGNNVDTIRILDTNVIYSFAGQTLKTTTAFDTSYGTSDAPNGRNLIHVGAGATAVFKDGSIVATAQKTDKGLSVYGVFRTFDGAKTTIENMNVVYNGTKDSAGKSGIVFVIGDTNGPKGTELTVKNTVVTVVNAIGAEISGGTATFENVTFKNAGDDTSWNGVCVGVGYGGTATIKSGTYIAANNGDNAGYCVGIFSTGGTLKIEGGSFEGKLLIGTQAGAKADSVIEITGGTFGGKAFADMTQADWDAIVTDDAAVITGVGTGTVTITVAKAN